MALKRGMHKHCHGWPYPSLGLDSFDTLGVFRSFVIHNLTRQSSATAGGSEVRFELGLERVEIYVRAAQVQVARLDAPVGEYMESVSAEPVAAMPEWPSGSLFADAAFLLHLLGCSRQGTRLTPK